MSSGDAGRAGDDAQMLMRLNGSIRCAICDRPGCHIEECAVERVVAEPARLGRVCGCAVLDQCVALPGAIEQQLRLYTA